MGTPKIKFTRVWIWKVRDNMNFYLSFSIKHYRPRFKRAEFGKNFHPFLASASFQSISSAGSRVSVVSRHVPTSTPENVEKEKKFFLCPLQWVLGWDPFFSRAPSKWICLSRLTVSHCDHCNSKLSLVKLTHLFRQAQVWAIIFLQTASQSPRWGILWTQRK